MKYFLVILLFPLIGHSQCRYFNRIFNNITRTADIIYGNAPAITSFYISESFTTPQDLKLDLFRPIPDLDPKRPLIIFAHSGGFINGTKENQDMQALADTFAHYGYVTASMEYRLNFNLLSSNSSERAVWRGIQDGSAAVRFFKQNSVLFGIDTNKIFVMGSSAGAFLALGLAYVDDSERPANTFTSPNLGCKNCSGNNYPSTSKVAGIISCWGATKDTSWIQNNNNIPVQLFHGTMDGTVPFTEGYPFGLATITYVRGSEEINEQLNRTSIYHEFYPAAGQDHEYWGTSNGTFVPTGPTIYWSDIINKVKVFLTDRMGTPQCGLVALNLLTFTAMAGNDVVNLLWNTADEHNLKQIIVERSNDGLAFDRLAEVTPKGSSGGGTSYNKTDFYPFSGISFYRLKLVNVDGGFTLSQVQRIQMPTKEISITQLFPNPVNDLLHVQIYSDKFRAVRLNVFDFAGRQMMSTTIQLNARVNETQIPFANWGRGMYFLQYKNEAGNRLSNIKIVKE